MLCRSVLSIVALGLTGIAAAQNPPATGQASARAIPQFQVEVLIFTHRDFDPNEEQFVLEDQRAQPDAETPREANESDVARAGDQPPSQGGTAPDGTPADNAAPPENEFTFRVLRPEELQLTSQYRTLTRLQAYHPLVHGGWVQLGLPDNEALPVDVGVLGVTNPSGTIRLSLTRFLHVKLDLSYVEGQPAQAGSAPAQGALAEQPLPTRYHLSAERTTRSGELHYFDHPAFGVLIKVTPIKPAPNGPGGTRPAA
jgi:Peptidoglycan-binding protein, CsiV